MCTRAAQRLAVINGCSVMVYGIKSVVRCVTNITLVEQVNSLIDVYTRCTKASGHQWTYCYGLWHQKCPAMCD